MSKQDIESIDLGEVSIRKTPRAINWFVRYRFNGARIERSLSTPHRGAAIKKALSIIEELKQGNDPFDKLEPITFRDFIIEDGSPFRKRWKRWGTDHTKSQWGTAIRLAATWASRNLHTIEKKDCDKFLSGLLDAGRSPATVNRYLYAMRVMFAQAKEWGYLKNDPTESRKPYKEEVNAPDYLTREQVSTIYRLIAPQYKHIVALAVNTGMRMGEIHALRWSDVHFDKKEIQVNVRKGKVGEWIPMSSDLQKALEPLKKKTGYVVSHKKDFRDTLRYPLLRCRKLAYISNALREAEDSTDPKFIKDLKRSFLLEFESKLSTHMLNEAVERGSSKDVELPHLHPHLFRHTFATWTQDNGATIGATKDLLGHSTLAMTLRYAKATNKQKNQAIESLPADLLSDGGDDK